MARMQTGGGTAGCITITCFSRRLLALWVAIIDEKEEVYAVNDKCFGGCLVLGQQADWRFRYYGC